MRLAFLLLYSFPVFIAAVNPFAGKRLFVDPNSDARKQQQSWQRSRPQDAAAMEMIASQPTAIWLGEWSRDIRREADARVSQIARAGALPVFVAYNIPHRDCGSYSAGGAGDAASYRRWIIDLARGINNRPAVVILEPDAMTGADCLPARLRDERYLLLQEAARNLSAGNVAVYIDAGHPRWKAATEVAQRLTKSGIEQATGFSLNVSNYYSTSENVTFGNRVSGLTGNKHYVIDTSRNGAGTNGTQWCNVQKQALGPAPTTQTNQALADAYLWIKVPGQSDGTCNGGPNAGRWWADYALELSKMAQVLKSTMPR